jgi:hypothetical protein
MKTNSRKIFPPTNKIHHKEEKKKEKIKIKISIKTKRNKKKKKKKEPKSLMFSNDFYEDIITPKTSQNESLLPFHPHSTFLSLQMTQIEKEILILLLLIFLIR